MTRGGFQSSGVQFHQEDLSVPFSQRKSPIPAGTRQRRIQNQIAGSRNYSSKPRHWDFWSFLDFMPRWDVSILKHHKRWNSLRKISIWVDSSLLDYLGMFPMNSIYGRQHCETRIFTRIIVSFRLFLTRDGGKFSLWLKCTNLGPTHGHACTCLFPNMENSQTCIPFLISACFYTVTYILFYCTPPQFYFYLPKLS